MGSKNAVIKYFGFPTIDQIVANEVLVENILHHI